MTDSTQADSTEAESTEAESTDPRALLARLRTAAPSPDESSTIERLLAQLLADAEHEQLTDATYRVIDSPVGPLLLAGTPAGLVRVAFDRQDHPRILDELAATVGSRILHAPNGFDVAVRQLDEYFAGARTGFSLPVDLRLAHGFRRAVLGELRRIEYGRTSTYTQVAAGAGSPRAVRAVGTACAKNPLPIVIPCHRVLRSDGALGGYVGGEAAKRTLLSLEGSL